MHTASDRRSIPIFQLQIPDTLQRWETPDPDKFGDEKYTENWVMLSLPRSEQIIDVTIFNDGKFALTAPSAPFSSPASFRPGGQFEIVFSHEKVGIDFSWCYVN